MDLGYFVTGTRRFRGGSGCFLYGCWHNARFDDTNYWPLRDIAVIDRSGTRIQTIEIRAEHVDGEPAFHSASPIPAASTPFFLTDRTDYRLVYADKVNFTPDNKRAEDILTHPSGHGAFAVFGRGWAGALVRKQTGVFRRRWQWMIYGYSAISDFKIPGIIGAYPQIDKYVYGTLTH